MQALPNMIYFAFLQKVLGEILLFLKLTINNCWLNVLLETPYIGLLLKEWHELQIMSQTLYLFVMIQQSSKRSFSSSISKQYLLTKQKTFNFFKVLTFKYRIATHLLKGILTITSKFLPVGEVPHLYCFTSSFAFSIKTHGGIVAPTSRKVK